jgi:hypothetical protein
VHVVTDGDHQVAGTHHIGHMGGAAGSIRRPCARATRTARGWTSCAGSVPADAAGMRLRRCHSTAASWEWAELWVQTKTTRSGAAGGGRRRGDQRERLRD